MLNYININERNYNGDTPVHHGTIHWIQILLKKKKLTLYYLPSFLACDDEFMQLAISRGADINARNNFGDTPLHARKARISWLNDSDQDVLKTFVRNSKLGK